LLSLDIQDWARTLTSTPPVSPFFGAPEGSIAPRINRLERSVAVRTAGGLEFRLDGWSRVEELGCKVVVDVFTVGPRG